MVSAALQALEELYREGVEYAKAGVMLSQFDERGAVTADLLSPAPRAGSKALMQAGQGEPAEFGKKRTLSPRMIDLL